MHKLWCSLMLAAILSTGCSTFRGPGRFQRPDERPQKGSAANMIVEPIPATRDAGFVLSWPVTGARLTQEFRPAGNPDHLGLDLASAKGTPIYAAHEGRVIYTGSSFHGYGRMVLIEYNNGEWATLYGHLNKIHVRQGQWVRRGTKVGAMGRSGRTSGVHLHFELIHKKLPIDPLVHLPAASNIARSR